jgi:hypothetical protein
LGGLPSPSVSAKLLSICSNGVGNIDCPCREAAFRGVAVLAAGACVAGAAFACGFS